MTDDEGLELDELEEQEGEALPEREAMPTVDGGMSPPFLDEPPKYDTPPDRVDPV